MKEKIPLKYECLDRFQTVIKECTDDNAAKLLIEMFDLIVYQMNEIKEQRMEIIAIKHATEWKRYDKKINDTVDKPPKSDKMVC